MCNAAEETVFHIVSECRVHAQTEYEGRHDKLAKVIHWDLCKKYDHVPEKVEETDHVKILWDFNIQKDHVIEQRRPNVVVLDKHEKMCHLIDIAVLGDSTCRVASKENEKVQKHQEALEKHLKEIGRSVRVQLLHKAALLGTARILQKTLEI